MTHEGHLPGSSGYRRIVWSLFAAGLATFTLLYSTQALRQRSSSASPARSSCASRCPRRGASSRAPVTHGRSPR